MANQKTVLRRLSDITSPEIVPDISKAMKRKSKWDLYEHGVSYSHLSKIVNCRERARIRLVEGLVESERKEAMEFGTIFHKALEISSTTKSTSQIMATMTRWGQSTSADIGLCQQAGVLLPYYREHWKGFFKEYTSVAPETVFRVPFKCSLGKTVYLNGRRDEILKKITTGELWLQENKTKGRIDEDKIESTLSIDLQTMIYMYSMREEFKGRLGGVLYNVIRKPQLKRNMKETEQDFLHRISDDISQRPEHYFKIFEVPITDMFLDQWVKRYLNPLICSVVVWWESIKHNPFDPWTGADGQPNPHHWARPFGVFDPMSVGKGDYFEYVVNGNRQGLIEVDDPFPELAERSE